MTPAVKGLLIGCVVLVLLGVIVLVAVGWYVKQKAPEVLANAQAAQSEGSLFGNDVSESQCVSNALERYRANPGLAAAMTQSLWLDGCLETSQVEQNFCDGVPAESEIIKSATWRVATCEESGILQDATCPNLAGRVQSYCAGDARRTKLAAVQ